MGIGRSPSNTTTEEDMVLIGGENSIPSIIFNTAAELRLQTVTMKPYVNEVTFREQKPPLKCC